MATMLSSVVNKVSTVWGAINSSTYSGAVDIIVVRYRVGIPLRKPSREISTSESAEQKRDSVDITLSVPTTDSPKYVYRCSPFHVRFGKTNVLNARDKVVSVEINGEICELTMKLDAYGVAYFDLAGDPPKDTRSPEEKLADRDFIAVPEPRAHDDTKDEEDRERRMSWSWGQMPQTNEEPSRSRASIAGEEFVQHFDDVDFENEADIAEEPTRYERIMNRFSRITSRLTNVVGGRETDDEMTVTSNYSDHEPSYHLHEPSTDAETDIMDDHPGFPDVSPLRPPSDMLAKLGLKPGHNEARFIVTSRLQGTTAIEADIFLWDCDDSTKIVISDVDGTITKSNVTGLIANSMGTDYSHEGVQSCYKRFRDNGYKLLYLTARGCEATTMTKDYLFRVIKQNDFEPDDVGVPQGPVLSQPDSMFSSVHREVVEKRPQDFKIPALLDVKGLFPSTANPFVAAFGNNVTDLISYLAIGVPQHHIFIVDKSGKLHREYQDSQEELTYTQLAELMDAYFPPLSLTE